MKNCLYILIFILPLFVSVNSFSQGDLQFNRVVNMSYFNSSPDTLVVPAGKVLKITSTSLIDINRNPVTGKTVTISNILVYNHLAYSDETLKHESFPIWFGPGNHIILYTGPYSFSFSGIEFNVVP